MTTITQINTPHGRRYQTSVGILPSVTTILGGTRPLEQQVKLQKWRDKHSASESTNRGTRFHALVEAHFSGEDPACPEDLIPFWQPARQVVLALDQIFAVEEAVYHPELRYAGTPDVIALWREKVTLIDWKTSYRPKRLTWLKDDPLQGAAYKGAFETLHPLTIEQIMIVVISPNRLQTFEFDLNEIEHYWQQWLLRLNQYQQLSKISTS